MKEINEMNVNELKALAEMVKSRMAELKASDKAEKETSGLAKVGEVNAMLKAGTLRKGSMVVVLYKGNEVEGVIATEPKVDSDNLTVNSLDFDGKVDEKGEKRRYVKKSNFVKLA